MTKRGWKVTDTEYCMLKCSSEFFGDEASALDIDLDIDFERRGSLPCTF